MSRREVTWENSFECWCLQNNPGLLKEWHPTKNGELRPSDISKGANTSVWWKGECGHEWDALLINRIHGNSCPYCAGRKVLIGFNDLSSTHPHIAEEWHPIKNENLKPTDVSKGSHKKVWWLGKCGHEWDMVIYSRVNGKNCPYCSGKRVLVGFNDLQTINPRIAMEWHPTKNGELNPTDVVSNCNKKVWWLCKNGHEWEAVVSSRNAGYGCKVCAGQAAIIGVNDIASQRPDLILDWDFGKNKSDPKEYALHSNIKLWWKCKDCGFSWKTSPNVRCRSGCPKCSGEYHTSFGEKAISYYLSQIVEVVERYHDPSLGKMELDIFIPSIRVAIEYDGQYYHRNPQRDLKKDKLCRINGIDLVRLREIDCPYIDSNTIIVDPYNRKSLSDAICSLISYLNTKYGIEAIENVDVERDFLKISELKYHSRKENSLASLYPHLAKEFHPTKNGFLKPDRIPAHSNQMIWWMCEKGHEWSAVVSSRTSGRNCPYCGGKAVQPGFNDLCTTNPDVASEWNHDKNGSLKPSDVSSGSNKKVWWIGKCGHEWDATVYHRVKGRGCPYCSGKRVLKGFNDLESLEPSLASEWHPTRNGDVKPDSITSRSNRKIWWMCSQGHEWEASANYRAKTRSCPYCARNNQK